jgi:hypothetical protein
VVEEKISVTHRLRPLALFAAIALPTFLYLGAVDDASARHRDRTGTPGDFAYYLPALSVVITCSGQEAPRLREVHVCLDRDLAPRACSADVLRGACRAPQVIIPPIR